MSSETITIPDTTASHVVGDTSLDIAHGELTLALALPSENQDKIPLFTMTIGKAAFPLYKTTVFGTVAGDERMYVFEPELGDEALAGYIKITLPEDVKISGSQLRGLQVRFEEMLVDKGLLKAADDSAGSATQSVTIPDVNVTHVIGETNVELVRGDLTLSSANSAARPNSVLILSVGKASFPLQKDTLFGTVADEERVYIFRPEADAPESAQVGTGFLKITLPEVVTHEPSFVRLQEKFEQILIDHGLLKTGIEAVGDELGRSVREDAVSTAQAIRETTAEYLHKYPPTSVPVNFTTGTHRITSKSASATQSLYSAAQNLSSSVSNVASSAGAWVSAQVGPVNIAPSTKEALGSVAQAYDSASSGIRAGVGEVTDGASEAVGQVVQNEWGPEARVVGGRAADTAGNLTGAVGQAGEVVTGGAVARGAAQAAADVPLSDAGEQEIQPRVQEMDTFVNKQKDEGGEWKEIPV